MLGRAGLEPTSSGHEPGMFPFTPPPEQNIALIKEIKTGLKKLAFKLVGYVKPKT